MGKETSAHTLKRLIWLLDTVYRAGDIGITKREIFERWQDNVELSNGEEYPERTFRNHTLRDIPSIFGVDIECTKGHRYRIEYPEDMERDAVTSWMINSISLRNTIVGSTKLRNRVLFEPIPAGEHLLRPIVDAIDDSLTVHIEYKRFHEAEPIQYVVEPYFLKLFRRRWYLVGYCREMERIYTFSLDRLRQIEQTMEHFTMPDINEVDFFANSFGIIWSANDKPTTIKIRVYGEQMDYIRSLPLHVSQKEVTTESDYADFKYFVLITYDFVQELLSHGENLEVLEPIQLRQEMKRHAEAMMKYYH